MQLNDPDIAHVYIAGLSKHLKEIVNARSVVYISNTVRFKKPPSHVL